MTAQINILYVDDEENNLNSFSANFRSSYNLFLAKSGKQGLAILKKEKIHVLISDQRMPEMTGTKFLTEAKLKYPKTLRILLTAFPEKAVMLEAINELTIFRWLDKPFVEQDIREAIDEAYEYYRVEEEGEDLRQELIKINGKFNSLISEKDLMLKLVLSAAKKS